VVRHPEAVVVQVGATFLPSLRPGTPFVVLTDGNIELARQAADVAASDARHLTAADIAAVRAREARVYARADFVLTLSDRVAESVVSDFGVPAERVAPMYAGPNLPLDSVPDVGAVPSEVAPTILFVGRQFERKGGDLLLAAFALVREAMPQARLVLIGPRTLPTVPPGVEFLGLIDKQTPEGWAAIVRAYTEASVFCLPSRYEGFPISVLEAMLFARPCVVLRFPWMRAEMVEDGTTGYAIEGEDVGVLAERLLRLLGDASLASHMGAAGRRRVLERFTWPHTVRRIADALTRLDRLGLRGR
jgi:glycosyltransferase involved in cell wall biosynthesis